MRGELKFRIYDAINTITDPSDAVYVPRTCHKTTHVCVSVCVIPTVCENSIQIRAGDLVDFRG